MSIAKIIVGLIALVIFYFSGLLVVTIIDREDKLSNMNKVFKIIIPTVIGFAIFFFIEELYKSGCHVRDWDYED